MSNPRNNIDIYYPYHPSVGGNVVFFVVFLIFGLIFAYQAMSQKKYFVGIASLFALSEAGGYLARLLFALEINDLYPKYLAQVIILVLAPNFIQAYMYGVTAELIGWSNLHEGTLIKKYGKNLPSYFILIDFVCLIIQGIAGGVMGSPDATQKQIDEGKQVILIGLALQLGSLFIFTFVVYLFIRQLTSIEYQDLQKFNFSLIISIILVIIRNVYRVVEFAEGTMTSGTLNQEEVYFFLGDGVTMVLSCAVLAYWSIAYLPAKYDPVKGVGDQVNEPQLIAITPKVPEKRIELTTVIVPVNNTNEEWISEEV